jgi:alkaline phosphatase D
MNRRDVLKLTVFGAAAATGLSKLTGCDTSALSSARVFPQGLASGDPRPDRIVLWTRVEPAGAGAEHVEFEIAEDADFERVVAAGDVSADADADHTVRVLVTGLSPATSYWYRFVARGVSSIIGRTRTAPAADSDVPVRFAVASCQDYVGRYFHGWAVLADEPPVDFVVFLGDYIYETTRTADARVPTEERQVQLPDGLPMAVPDDGIAAVTLPDYRALYRTWKSDPDLQRIHAMVPFILIWDDHEFANDCWQDRTYYFEGAEGDEKRTDAREAATRAWFEYLPVDVSWRADAAFPEDITTYRALTFGRHVELFLTDGRYYRDANIVQPGPRAADVGKIGTNTIVGSRIFLRKEGFDAREAEAAPSMLGATQRDWFLGVVRESTATWKLWCNQTMLAQLLINLRMYPEVLELVRDVYYFKVDQWDGYRSERRRILEELADVTNFVAISGDLHGFYAAELRGDFDAPGPASTVEYVVSSISAPSLQEQLDAAVRISPLLRATRLGQLVPRSDEVLMASNPHLLYSNSRTYGFGIVEVDATELRVEFVMLTDVLSRERPDAVERVRFRTALNSAAVEEVSG